MNRRVSWFFLVAGDLVSIFVSLCVAVFVRKSFNLFWDVPEIDYSYLSFYAIYITSIIIYSYFGLYHKRADFWHETSIVLKANFLAFIILFAGLALGKNAEYYSRLTLCLIFLFSSIIVPIGKFFLKTYLFKVGIWYKKAKVLSDNQDFKHQIFDDPYLGYITSSSSDHDILFIDSTNLDKSKLNRIIESNIKHNREIIFTPVLNEYDFSRSYIYNVFNSRSNVFTIENKLLSKKNIFYKTSLDYILVILSIFFWVPLLCIIALWIKSEDRNGSVFFMQRRLGKDGKEFMCYKFRTMYTDQSFMSQWLEKNPEEKAYYNIYHKYMNDPRVTRVGAFLRKTSLDEIPQLINVLRGEMSLIGPRPYMMIEQKDIGSKDHLVLAVKPGITGLWQVSGRSDVDFDSRVDMDVWYVKNWSLWNDIIILLKTFQTVLRRDGAY